MDIIDQCLNLGRSLLFTGACLACGARSERHHGLCDPCREQLQLPGERCPRCAAPCPGARICGRCQSDPPGFDRCIAAIEFDGLGRELIHRLKYRNDLALARPLGHLLATAVTDRLPESRPDLIVPVPLHYTSLMTRGYNQSMSLARPVARATGVGAAPGAARRLHRARRQQGLSAAERRANVRGAFAARPLHGQRVAIVDDVMTTGETLDSLARALRVSGADAVECWVLARA